MDYFKFIEKYWWLRSPSTGYNYGTWSVWPGGSLDSYYYIEDSYGRRSPLTWDVAGAYDVRSSGDVGYYYDSDGVIPSYGRTISPDTHWNNSSILLNPSGKIDIEVKWVDDSYGKIALRTRIIPVGRILSIRLATSPTTVSSIPTAIFLFI